MDPLKRDLEIAASNIRDLPEQIDYDTYVLRSLEHKIAEQEPGSKDFMDLFNEIRALKAEIKENESQLNHSRRLQREFNRYCQE